MSAYPFLYQLVHAVLRLWHPVFKVTGRENIPQDTALVICGNHSGMMDPAWILFAMKLRKECPCIMAKESVMKIPVIGAILRHVGVFGIRRGENDVHAVKEGLSALKNGRSLLLFPEGTRVKPGKIVEPKSGAVLFATRTQTPILPVYLEARRYPFSPLRCVIGKPWMPPTESRKATPEELHRLSKDLMEKIYKLGETK